MYAVIRERGKQYTAREGEELLLDRRASAEGEELTLEEVLLISRGDTIVVGAPLISNARVHAVVVGERRGAKRSGMKVKRRKKYRRHYGHKPCHTLVRVTRIEEGGA